MSNPPDSKSGTLQKKGGGTSLFGRKNWKDRHFTLRYGVFAYYESVSVMQQGGSCIKSSPLGAGCYVEEKIGELSFKIIIPERKHGLEVRFKTRAEYLDWLQAVQAHVAYGSALQGQPHQAHPQPQSGGILPPTPQSAAHSAPSNATLAPKGSNSPLSLESCSEGASQAGSPPSPSSQQSDLHRILVSECTTPRRMQKQYDLLLHEAAQLSSALEQSMTAEERNQEILAQMQAKVDAAEERAAAAEEALQSRQERAEMQVASVSVPRSPEKVEAPHELFSPSPLLQQCSILHGVLAIVLE